MEFGLDIDAHADQHERQKQARQIWLENVEACMLQGAIETARSVLKNAIALDTADKSLWMRAQQLEAKHGSIQSLSNLLNEGVKTAQHEFLFIEYASVLHKKLNSSAEAISILTDGLTKHPDSEEMVVSLQNLHRIRKEYGLAKDVLRAALARKPT